jgi:hypothetical protein
MDEWEEAWAEYLATQSWDNVDELAKIIVGQLRR